MYNLIPFRKDKQPVRPGSYLQELFEPFFQDDFFHPFQSTGNLFHVDLKETNDSYQIEADLPGMKREDMELEYANNYLTITAKRELADEPKGENVVRRERKFGEFQRSFHIDNVDEDKIDAHFSDGVLIVTLPKKDKQRLSGKKIAIH